MVTRFTAKTLYNNSSNNHPMLNYRHRQDLFDITGAAEESITAAVINGNLNLSSTNGGRQFNRLSNRELLQMMMIADKTGDTVVKTQQTTKSFCSSSIATTAVAATTMKKKNPYSIEEILKKKEDTSGDYHAKTSGAEIQSLFFSLPPCGLLMDKSCTCSLKTI